MSEPLLELSELVPNRGTWGGVLFDNPRIGLAPSLTWEFAFDFAEIERDHGATTPHLHIGWVPLSVRSWAGMAGTRAASTTFAEPVEPSFYFFEHFRLDTMELHVADQDGAAIRVVARASGDVDDLGLDALHADAWLDFAGITVSLSDPPRNVRAATKALRRFTDVSGLVGSALQRGFRFAPPGR